MIGDNIKKLMMKKGYTEAELAERAGCSRSAISRYINNNRTPKEKMLQKLADGLGVSVTEIVRYGR